MLCLSAYQVGGDTFVIHKGSHPFDNRVWCWEYIKVSSFNYQPCCQAKETVGTLHITGGAEAKCWCALHLHAVHRCVVLVDFAISVKRGPTVVMIVKFVVENYLAWIELI
jgi:hypothetical protein